MSIIKVEHCDGVHSETTPFRVRTGNMADCYLFKTKRISNISWLFHNRNNHFETRWIHIIALLVTLNVFYSIFGSCVIVINRTIISHSHFINCHTLKQSIKTSQHNRSRLADLSSVTVISHRTQRSSLWL